MTGWERVVVRDSNQKRYALIQPTGARTGNQMLQEYIANQNTHGKTCQQNDPILPVFLCAEQPTRCQDPDGTTVSQHCDEKLWGEVSKVLRELSELVAK